ncbi:MAG: phosphoribosylamine--glycine ligase [Deltaproteobacteria bacterium]|jgi:phosphoribosylamine--glycine ligase|nr:phosphoribosylamine--glycine ligase [Deltaproteobacteria bacterium]
MLILLIGSGGREHALAWQLRKNPETRLVSAPGSPALATLGDIRPVAVDDLEGLKALALEIKPDLVVIGPELPLVLGLADILRAEGIPVFGPSKEAAKLEGSKVFAKDFMIRHNLPTAGYAVFYEQEDARDYLKKVSYPIVLKADGLAAGKGVIICGNQTTALNGLASLAATEAGKKIIVEDFLAGEEVSFFGITDGKNVLPLPSAQDHKAIYDGDRGPNTGGMGAYAPAPLMTPALQQTVMRDIMMPAVQGMAVEGHPFCGLLYAGLMVSLSGAKLLEFNARFGDPETQALMPLIESDLSEIFMAAATGVLEGKCLKLSSNSSVCVVLSAEGYPGPYRRNDPITGIEAASARPDTVVFEAGVGRVNGTSLTNGGRVLGVTATGTNIKDALEKTYLACGDIHFKGAHYRRDIGAKAFRLAHRS